MPQGKRKVPFSVKAKKQQLQFKKAGKTRGRTRPLLVNDQSTDDDDHEVQKLNFQPKSTHSRRDLNRYVLEFHKESDFEIRMRKEEARMTLDSVETEALEVNLDEYFPPELDFPKRPVWDYNMSKQELEIKENRYFSDYIKKLEKEFNWKELSYFELNLETWRQLWRVLEMADIVLIVVDARYPALMFPPSLYTYVTQTMSKDMIMVLNKVDLVPAPLVAAWKHYFTTKFPNLHIIYFTSLPGYNLRGNSKNTGGLITRRRRGRVRMSAEGAQKLFEACKEIVKDAVDLSSWQEKISEEMNLEYNENDAISIGQVIEIAEQDSSYSKESRCHNGILTIGCIGQPNVGKSSLMNALMGKKVVSVSKTPGHTKHFQTIFLTKNVRLCDCPGLVFPSKVPKSLQILMGSFPIAQVREPYSTIRYLAQRIDLVNLLKLQHPDGESEWSAMDICDGWALKRQFYTARAARLDSYRAANNLLRMALDGKISFCLHPPNYSKNADFYENEYKNEIEEVRWIQAEMNGGMAGTAGGGGDSHNSDDSDGSESPDSHPRGPRAPEDTPSPDVYDDSSSDSVAAIRPTSNKFVALNLSE